MKIFRSILAVLSAPVIFGLVCVPLVGVLMALDQDLVNDMGGTFDFALTVQVELLQFVILLIIGFLVATIAPSRPMLHAASATLLMLVIGISVQVSLWDSMLVWHHFVFFASIVLCLFVGSWGRVRMTASSGEGAVA